MICDEDDDEEEDAASLVNSSSLGDSRSLTILVRVVSYPSRIGGSPGGVALRDRRDETGGGNLIVSLLPLLPLLLFPLDISW